MPILKNTVQQQPMAQLHFSPAVIVSLWGSVWNFGLEKRDGSFLAPTKR